MWISFSENSSFITSIYTFAMQAYNTTYKCLAKNPLTTLCHTFLTFKIQIILTKIIYL